MIYKTSLLTITHDGGNPSAYVYMYVSMCSYKCMYK